MNKGLFGKITLIICLILLAVYILHPIEKKLKPGRDLAGGTSLIYEIDAFGLNPAEKRELSSRMITVLRRRVDPKNVQNLLWRPLGATRFEIQMPLASKLARENRERYEKALNALLEDNINIAAILQVMNLPAEQRDARLNELVGDTENKKAILENLITLYDQRTKLQAKRDESFTKLEELREVSEDLGVNFSLVRSNLPGWSLLNEEELGKEINEFLTENEVTIVDEIGSVLKHYVEIYKQWSDVVGKLTAEGGINEQFNKAKLALDELNLSEDQIKSVLDMPEESPRRASEIEKLVQEFPQRDEKIREVVDAFDAYRPYRGGLDDPKDLQRMLKGAGVLEWRILPSIDDPSLSADEAQYYKERLKSKGPKYASDEKYIWVQIEDIEEWNNPRTYVESFGEDFYVLASNQSDEVMLHNNEENPWKLKSARPSQDQNGARAIGFTLDQNGGIRFSRITGENVNRPLAILLDDFAISAPNISTRIGSSGIITGVFDAQEQMDMVNKLNAGSLPGRLIEQPISVKTVGPAIGKENAAAGIKAGLIGFIIVVIFIVIYYMYAGAIADAALFLNVLFILAIMAFLGATFTLPGIAGIILTIGMSIDANVLIFERIREEKQRGSSLRIALANGYNRALTTILDANITTFITAFILYKIASEEIKGFAIVLMLGILSSMFTALFVTRVVFDLLISARIIKDKLPMMQIVKKPSVNWMALRPAFLTISIILVVGGLSLFFGRDEEKNSKYDIEFTGGTSAQVDLIEPMTREEVEAKFEQTANETGNPRLATATIYRIGESDTRYEINTTETNKTTVNVTLAQAGLTLESAKTALRKAQVTSDVKLEGLQVAMESPTKIVIQTSQVNKSAITHILGKAFPDAAISQPVTDDIVNRTILNAFEGNLKIKTNLQPTLVSEQRINDELAAQHVELTRFVGGLALTIELEKPVTMSEMQQRINDMKMKPEMENVKWYNNELLTADFEPWANDKALSKFAFVSVLPDAGFREIPEGEWNLYMQTEKNKVLSAAQMETSLSRVTQFAPSVGREARNSAIVAIILSLIAIVIYIWFRFGNWRYGIAAIVALVHDVSITLGAVVGTTYIAGTPLGEALLIGDFKINLAIIAAFLTLIGYSLNDTIVVFDRIRENRHKAQLTARTISESINQTLSRTLLTSLTTFLVVLIMYIYGGPNLRGFTFAIGFGVIVGTYSSIAIAAPILLIGRKKSKNTQN